MLRMPTLPPQVSDHRQYTAQNFRPLPSPLCGPGVAELVGRLLRVDAATRLSAHQANERVLRLGWEDAAGQQRAQAEAEAVLRAQMQQLVSACSARERAEVAERQRADAAEAAQARTQAAQAGTQAALAEVRLKLAAVEVARAGEIQAASAKVDESKAVVAAMGRDAAAAAAKSNSLTLEVQQLKEALAQAHAAARATAATAAGSGARASAGRVVAPGPQAEDAALPAGEGLVCSVCKTVKPKKVRAWNQTTDCSLTCAMFVQPCIS